jgi:hypothetical protein
MMEKRGACDECLKIREELRGAVADAWLSADQKTKDARVAMYRMIGGTEADAERAEQLLAPFVRGPESMVQNRVHAIMSRMSLHAAQSGHKRVSLRDIFLDLGLGC